LPSRGCRPFDANGSKPAQAVKDLLGSDEAWINGDPFRGEVVVLITGPPGFERAARFALDAEPYDITEHVWATLED